MVGPSLLSFGLDPAIAKSGNNGNGGGNGNGNSGGNGNGNSGNNGNGNSGNNGNGNAGGNGNGNAGGNGNGNGASNGNGSTDDGESADAGAQATEASAVASAKGRRATAIAKIRLRQRAALRRSRMAHPQERVIARKKVPSPHAQQAGDTLIAVGLDEHDLERLSRNGFRRTTSRSGGVVRLRPPPGLSLAEARARARTIARGATVDLDHFYYPDGDAGGTACAAQGCDVGDLVGLASLAARQCGSLPPVGMIDTAIDRYSDALRGADVEVVEVRRERPSRPSGTEHGTAIASLLVGRPVAGAPQRVKLVAVDAFTRDAASNDRADAGAVVEAVDALVARGVKVVNLSFSGPANAVLERSLMVGRDKGVVFVAAAGNGGPGASPSFPAAYPGVIAVTAVDEKLAVYPRATRGKYIALAAPGVRIPVPGLAGKPKTGTSFAVPFVTAAAALLRGQDGTASSGRVADRLTSMARDLGEPGYDTTFGWGLLQAQGLCPDARAGEVEVSRRVRAPPT